MPDENNAIGSIESQPDEYTMKGKKMPSNVEAMNKTTPICATGFRSIGSMFFACKRARALS